MSNLFVPASNRPRVIIVGGGFAGLQAAKKLRNSPVQVVLLDRHNYHTFQPLLYQVATAGLEPDSIAFPLRKIFKGYKNLIFRMARVEAVDLDQRTLKTELGNISYDYLILATGSVTNFFGNERFRLYTAPMKTVPQALDLRSLILQNLEQSLIEPKREGFLRRLNFLVVGGGPTGVETAGALAELRNHVLPSDYPELDLRKMQVHLVEAAPRLLMSMSTKAGEKAAKYLEELGVQLWFKTSISDYDGQTVHLSDGQEIPSATVIWAAGVMGTPLQGIPEEFRGRQHRIKVDTYGRMEGQERVYVAGDLAFAQTSKFTDGLPMVAPAAIQQGRNVAQNILRSLNNKPLKPFRYRDKGSMATVGRRRAVAELPMIRFYGVRAWYAWLVVHLLTLMGFRNRVVVFINWMWNYISYDRAARLIIRPYRRKKDAPNT